MQSSAQLFRPRTASLAVWSLVLGILGLTCFWLFAGIPAVICGHLAYGRIRRSGGTLGGEGLAMGGLITGYISIALSVFVIPLLAALAIPNFVKARETAQMNVCLSHLRRIDAATQQWALEYKKTEQDTVTYEDITPYLGAHVPVCPAGGTSFADSYTVTSAGESPKCRKRPDQHVLPVR